MLPKMRMEVWVSQDETNLRYPFLYHTGVIQVCAVHVCEIQYGVRSTSYSPPRRHGDTFGEQVCTCTYMLYLRYSIPKAKHVRSTVACTHSVCMLVCTVHTYIRTVPPSHRTVHCTVLYIIIATSARLSFFGSCSQAGMM